MLFAIFGVIVVVGLAAVVASLGLAGNLLYICEPNEVLIFSGKRRKLESGQVVGYRIVKGGRAWRTPLLEKVDRLDLTNIIIDVTVQNAYSLGGIPLNIQGVANVKIAGHEPVLGHAVERILGKDREHVKQIAKDVLEGTLRGVLSRLTPEEVNEDKIAFAENLLEEAEHDLAKLGLVLDTLKVQNVADDRGYLNSIGRKRSAEIIKKSRIAEAESKAKAMIQDATNRERARLQEIHAKQQIVTAEATRRIQDAKTRTASRVAEEKGKVDAMIARAESAMEAEQARVEKTRLQLEADVIQPAAAQMEADTAAAQGRAARILEDGRATVRVLEEMITVWQAAGPNARDIFLMQKLQTIMDSMVATLDDVKIDQITMLPSAGADGEGSAAAKAVRVVEELKGALGVDLPKLLEQAVESRKR
ncbi:MAG: flotillin family protein [Deltaproteobacteria bacterium]|nr:flotillin family protein [Deltaproteobacteria bacterium]